MRSQLVFVVVMSAVVWTAGARGADVDNHAEPAVPSAPPPNVAPVAPAPDAQATKGADSTPPSGDAHDDAEVQFATARNLLLSEDLPAAAIGPLTKFLALHPQHFQARLMRGYAHGRVGHYAEAQADYLAALDVMTGTSADEVLARAQEFSFSKQREIALTLIEDGIRRLGPLPNLESAALKLELNLKRPDAALARIKRMLERTQRKEMLYIKLGDILEELGRQQEAWDARRQAVAAIDELPESQRVGKLKRVRDDLVYRINRASRGGQLTSTGQF